MWSCLATIGDHIDEDRRLMKSVGRLATYLQGYGDLLVRTNGWDPAVLERFRADDVVAGFLGGIDSTATTDQLEHIATLIPDEWLAPSATGSPEQCAAAVRDQLAMGCDGVIMHGATPRSSNRSSPPTAPADRSPTRSRCRSAAVDPERPRRRAWVHTRPTGHGHPLGGYPGLLVISRPLGFHPLPTGLDIPYIAIYRYLT